MYMRFTVQYIPLSKLKPDAATRMTAQLRKLRRLVWDCMHLLVVRKNRRDGTYTILLGSDRYQYLREHTKKLSAPCLIDDSGAKADIRSWLHRWREAKGPAPWLAVPRERLAPVAWSAVRTLLKEEPRFRELTRSQQWEVLLLAVRCKQTVVASMKSKVKELSS